jgi:glucose-6-phosphate 1-dehydrogenase
VSVVTASATAADSPIEVPRDQVIVLFGATGDLAKRKLLPGMFHLARVGLMPERFRIVGAARRPVAVEEFRELAREAVEASGRRPVDPEQWERFAESLRFAGVGDGFDGLGEEVGAARAELSEDAGLLFYLSLPPRAAAGTVEAIGGLGLGAGARVITEKPFGTDLESARKLNGLLHSVFAEDCIYRIDHYLGREAVQNLLALRFANGMFEPVWNRNHIDHVQIEVPETLSIEMRGSFYEETGAFRDMVVTHMFQVLGFVAMEPPVSLDPKSLGREREKVIDSMTNWRWEGVPFFLRTGKRMAESRHLLTVAFKQPPRRMFALDHEQIDESFGHDHLTFELGDPGSISASFLAKVPGPRMQLGEAHMHFSYADSFKGTEASLDPYERLIHDVMLGDRTLFTSSEAIERLWEISAPLLADPPPAHEYEPWCWGPPEAGALIAPRHWHLPSDHV